MRCPNCGEPTYRTISTKQISSVVRRSHLCDTCLYNGTTYAAENPELDKLLPELLSGQVDEIKSKIEAAEKTIGESDKGGRKGQAENGKSGTRKKAGRGRGKGKARSKNSASPLTA